MPQENREVVGDWGGGLSALCPHPFLFRDFLTHSLSPTVPLIQAGRSLSLPDGLCLSFHTLRLIDVYLHSFHVEIFWSLLDKIHDILHMSHLWPICACLLSQRNLASPDQYAYQQLFSKNLLAKLSLPHPGSF